MIWHNGVNPGKIMEIMSGSATADLDAIIGQSKATSTSLSTSLSAIFYSSLSSKSPRTRRAYPLYNPQPTTHYTAPHAPHVLFIFCMSIGSTCVAADW